MHGESDATKNSEIIAIVTVANISHRFLFRQLFSSPAYARKPRWRWSNIFVISRSRNIRSVVAVLIGFCPGREFQNGVLESHEDLATETRPEMLNSSCSWRFDQRIYLATGHAPNYSTTRTISISEPEVTYGFTSIHRELGRSEKSISWKTRRKARRICGDLHRELETK